MRFDTKDGPLDFTPTRAIVAGWTGRDAAAVQHHIDELAALGMKRVPEFANEVAVLPCVDHEPLAGSADGATGGRSS